MTLFGPTPANQQPAAISAPALGAHRSSPPASDRADRVPADDPGTSAAGLAKAGSGRSAPVDTGFRALPSRRSSHQYSRSLAEVGADRRTRIRLPARTSAA